MAATLTKEQIALHKQQEARTFIGKNGVKYVQELATENEKKHFEGTLYHRGIPIYSLISRFASSLV